MAKDIQEFLETPVDAAAISRELDRQLSVKLALCTELERLADSLPHQADTQKCFDLAQELPPLLHHAHRFEEDVVFPLLIQNRGHDRMLGATLQRLRHEHVEDECYAEELHDYLIQFATDRTCITIETLSYMLRGFFEGLRRHIAFEKEHLRPLL